MKTKSAINKLKTIFKSELENLESTLIIRRGDQYLLFNRYLISKTDSSSYQVKKLNVDREILFASLKSATAWCVADRKSQHQLSKRIVDLDKQISILKNDISVNKQMLNKFTDISRREIIYAKFTKKQDLLRDIKNQLTKCINLTKYWQIKGFIRDEIA